MSAFSISKKSTDDKLIQDGYGDFIVYRNISGRYSNVTPEEYALIRELLKKYNFFSSSEACSLRYRALREEIQAIVPETSIVFIPHTLYELEILRHLITEDKKEGSFCPFAKIGSHWDYREKAPLFWTPENREKFLKKREGCWHLCAFDERIQVLQEDELREIAYRTNQCFIDWFHQFPPQEEGMSLSELKRLSKKIILFFTEQYAEVKADYKKLPSRLFDKSDFDCSRLKLQDGTPFPLYELPGMAGWGPTLSFSIEGRLGSLSAPSLGIRNKTDSKLVMKCIKLECSENAQNSIVLYRGSSGGESHTIRLYHSLSFGMGLFSGAVFDETATPFFYMRQKGLKKFAYVVPVNQLSHVPLKLGSTDTIEQLFSNGELFHPRTRAFVNNETNSISGFYLTDLQDRLIYQFEDSPEEYIQKMLNLLNTAVVL